MNNTYRRIPNPYIVGNPIKSKEMFFGRRDDFEYIQRKLEGGTKSFVIVFCGERRSGKTSILFQILNGELGERYLPILVDMQTLAGLRDEREFFEKVTREMVKSLPGSAPVPEDYDYGGTEGSTYKVFDRLLDDIHRRYPERAILLLLDEYELMESKIAEGTLSPQFVTYLAGILESERGISFVFTGSKRLDGRDIDLWRVLFAKSLYRNVSFLSKSDTFRLVAEPIRQHAAFEDDVLEAIYRLTAGQPFYTQVVCQNIVDHLNEHQKTQVALADLDAVVEAILANPLPQMMYFWSSQPPHERLVLSLLSEALRDESDQVAAEKLHAFSRKRDFGIHLTLKDVSTTLDSLYHWRYAKKADGLFAFQMDLFRQWIRRDHSVWQVMKEVGAEPLQLPPAEAAPTDRAPQVAAEATPSPNGDPAAPPAGRFWGRYLGAGAVALLAGGVGAYFWLQTPAGPAPPAVTTYGSGGQPEALPDTGPAAPSPGQQGEPAAATPRGPDALAPGAGEVDPATPAPAAPRQVPRTTVTPAPERAAVQTESSAEEVTRTRMQREAGRGRDRVRQAREAVSTEELRQTGAYRSALAAEESAEAAWREGEYQSTIRLYRQAEEEYRRVLLVVSDSLRDLAQGGRQAAEEARRLAEQAQAARWASAVVAQAAGRQAEGERLFGEARYGPAHQAFAETADLYHRAADSARAAASSSVSGDVVRLQEQVEQAQEELSADGRFAPQFREARSAAEAGARQAQEGSLAAAAASYHRALELLEDVRRTRARQREQIGQVMQAYEAALESKDLQKLERLHTHFTSEDRRKWSQVFESVERVEADFAVSEVSFRETEAVASVDGRLQYTGFVRSDQQFVWQVHFADADGSMLISAIKQSR
ncbi:MAG: hypothetical protein AB1505_14845 [Candidatus Latescibacterota bacterium]